VRSTRTFHAPDSAARGRPRIDVGTARGGRHAPHGRRNPGARARAPRGAGPPRGAAAARRGRRAARRRPRALREPFESAACSSGPTTTGRARAATAAPCPSRRRGVEAHAVVMDEVTRLRPPPRELARGERVEARRERAPGRAELAALVGDLIERRRARRIGPQGIGEGPRAGADVGAGGASGSAEARRSCRASET